MRKTGLTTSRSGELTLSDAEETLKRRTVDRDPVSSSLRYASPADITTPKADETATVIGPILTVNSVSNPAAARRTDRSPAPTSNGRRQTSTLSDAEETTLQQRTLERQRDHLSSSLRYGSPADTPKIDGTTKVTGPILTSNSVSNPATSGRVDRLSATNTSSQRQTPATTSGNRRIHTTSTERRYSFDDESQKFDWSATLNLLSRLDDGQSTTATTATRQRPEPVDVSSRLRQDTVEPPIFATHLTRSTDWEASLPAYMRGRSNSSGRDDWRSRTLSGQRGYSSDSEDSSDWLERQKQQMRQRKSTGSSSTPITSTVKARIVFPPPRTELERRLIDELKASQERLNVDKSFHHGPRNGLYSSCTLPRPSSSSSLTRGQSLTNGFYDREFSGDTANDGRFLTLPGKGRASDGGVQRAASELDFRVDTTRRGQSLYNNDTGFDKHRSLTSLRGDDNVVEQRLAKSSISRRTGELEALLMFIIYLLCTELGN